MLQESLLLRHGRLGCDESRRFDLAGAYCETGSVRMHQRLAAISQSTIIALQVGLPCDMARQAAIWQAGAARDDRDCDMQSDSATRNGDVWRARENADAAG